MFRQLMRKVAVATVSAALILALPASSQVSRSPVAPRQEVVRSVVNDAYEQFKNDTSGKNADYIPYLAQVDPKLFAIAIVTTDNQVLTLGDVSYSFSIQSISKVFTMVRVVEDSGAAAIANNMGVDATGQAFNSIVAIEQHKGSEMNPLVNTGAIAPE